MSNYPLPISIRSIGEVTGALNGIKAVDINIRVYLGENWHENENLLRLKKAFCENLLLGMNLKEDI